VKKAKAKRRSSQLKEGRCALGEDKGKAKRGGGEGRMKGSLGQNSGNKWVLHEDSATILLKEGTYVEEEKGGKKTKRSAEENSSEKKTASHLEVGGFLSFEKWLENPHGKNRRFWRKGSSFLALV